MKIKLQDVDGEPESVLITCADQVAALLDHTVVGARWEAPGDMSYAYAIVTDRPDLAEELENEGYELDLDEYTYPEV